MSDLQMILVSPTKVILAQVTQFVISALLAIILLIIGWLISKFIIKDGITKILKLAKVDKLAQQIELDKILSRGGITEPFSELVGMICYWLSVLVTIVVALNATGLTVAADLLQRIVLFVPNIVAAIFIFIVGLFASVVLRNIVRTAATNAGISQANLVGNIAETVIVIFTAAAALQQLQIGTRIIELTISVILWSLGLGFALAFGLGCKDMVGKSVSDFVGKLKK